jgi:porphobilinogen synthase
MFKRFRRLRINETLRNLVQETVLTADDFIYPLFVREGSGIKTEVSSMPGVYQMSLDKIYYSFCNSRCKRFCWK